MKLNITSLKGLEYEGDIKSLNIKTTSGEITILNHHRPLVTVLSTGVAKIVDSKDKTIEIPVQSGFLEVTADNAINILLD